VNKNSVYLISCSNKLVLKLIIIYFVNVTKLTKLLHNILCFIWSFDYNNLKKKWLY